MPLQAQPVAEAGQVVLPQPKQAQTVSPLVGMIPALWAELFEGQNGELRRTGATWTGSFMDGLPSGEKKQRCTRQTQGLQLLLCSIS